MSILNVATTLAALSIGSSPLQAQVDATPTGGTLLLEAQTYLGELVLDRAITIRGKGAAETFLQGAEGTVVTVRGSKGGEVVLEGLTIRGGGNRTKAEGVTRYGGGLNVGKGAKVRLNDILLKDNRAYWGAGISLEGELFGKNVTIEGNVGTGAGGLRASTDSVLELEDAVIRDNGSKGTQLEFFGQRMVLRKVVIKEARLMGASKWIHLRLFGPKPEPPTILLEQVTIGASSGSSVMVGAGRGGSVPNITLIDTPWPADAEAPEGWAPIVQKAQVGERATR